ncbi:type II toxin-antitoxin system VapC family toxin [Sphingomonas sp.]|jgi:hypothetical protein|uniref:type II toxin-antitoxin system VapC family toxin n=1 Tax=Sphingomonas sp. TaxID=28214 RepID=UPI002EDB3F2A
MVDTNVMLDILLAEGEWADWSRQALAQARIENELAVNHIVIAELAGHFADEAAVDDALRRFALIILPFTTDAALRSGRAFREYRRRGGGRDTVLADFLIAGHAAAADAALMTRDKKIASYFPELTLIAPETDNG